MAWTSSDLTSVEAAIVTLASGARVATISSSDGRSVTYTQASLMDLIKLRDVMRAAIGGQAGRPMCNLGQFSKG